MIQVEDRQTLLDIFEPSEGSIDLIYGRIGNGKTYCAVENILKDLKDGNSVWVNFPIVFEGYDERENFWLLFVRTIFFWKKRFYQFPKENLHIFNSDDVDPEFLSKITDAVVYIDEGQWIFDSYEGTKFSKIKRKLILHTRHLNRRLVIITQRPTAIQVSARGNINRFFKCEKWFQLGSFILFRQWEFQDMVSETVDESKPVGRPRVFIGKKRIFNAYNTHYLRGGIPRSQQLYVNAFDLTIYDRLDRLYKTVIHRLSTVLVLDFFRKKQ